MNDIKKQLFNKKNILVVGDAMLDIYCYGVVNRISPEAPVPIFNLEDEEHYLGGAANVAAVLSEMGHIGTLISVVSNDKYGDEIYTLLKLKEICSTYLETDCNRKTTTKIRMINDLHQVFRMDIEQRDDVDKTIEDSFLRSFEHVIEKNDLVLLSDYNKGVLTSKLVKAIIKVASENNKKVLADIKDKNYEKFIGCYLIKLNKLELSRITNCDLNNKNSMYESAILLKKKMNVSYCLITCGKDGMFLVQEDNSISVLNGVQTYAINVVGAGDLVLAYMGTCIANNVSIQKSIEVANIAAGIKVSKGRNYIVSIDEILTSLSSKKIKDKVVCMEDVDLLMEVLIGKKVVFTNGCFDLLHPGHIKLLNKAKKIGDILIVAINSDSSITKLKGNTRPIYNIEDRMMELGALSCVDYIIPFDDLTPIKLIEKIRPNILVKGGDYRNKEVVGRRIVESYGGEMCFIDLYNEYSTSNTINRLFNEMMVRK